MIFSMFTELCTHHPNLSQDIVITPKRNLLPLAVIPHFFTLSPYTQPQAITILLLSPQICLFQTLHIKGITHMHPASFIQHAFIYPGCNMYQFFIAQSVFLFKLQQLYKILGSSSIIIDLTITHLWDQHFKSYHSNKSTKNIFFFFSFTSSLNYSGNEFSEGELLNQRI